MIKKTKSKKTNVIPITNLQTTTFVPSTFLAHHFPTFCFNPCFGSNYYYYTIMISLIIKNYYCYS